MREREEGALTFFQSAKMDFSPPLCMGCSRSSGSASSLEDIDSICTLSVNLYVSQHTMNGTFFTSEETQGTDERRRMRGMRTMKYQVYLVRFGCHGNGGSSHSRDETSVGSHGVSAHKNLLMSIVMMERWITLVTSGMM